MRRACRRHLRRTARAGGGELLPAAISIGTNPTFAGRERRVEAYVLDAEPGLDLYGEQRAEFAARLRDTLRFDGVEPLVRRWPRTSSRTREVLVDHPEG